MNQRQYERYIVEFPVRLAGDCVGVGIVYNLCMGGCKIVTDQSLTVGGMVALALDVPREPLPISIRVTTVRWMLKHEFGIEFLGMEEAQRERLANYLQSLAEAAAA